MREERSVERASLHRGADRDEIRAADELEERDPLGLFETAEPHDAIDESRARVTPIHGLCATPPSIERTEPSTRTTRGPSCARRHAVKLSRFALGCVRAPRLTMSHFVSRAAGLVGAALGWAVAPLFALTSALRHARTFHPSGTVFLAEVTPLGHALGERLRGPALVRFSGALWKGDRERFDVLGCAIRFRHTEAPSPVADAGDQDLLFATIRRPWTMPFAPFMTNAHDYLANDYFAVSPFSVPGFGRAYLRLRPDDDGGRGAYGESRVERLLRAVSRGDAKMRFEVRRSWRHEWATVALVTLRRPVEIDQERLRFWPFRNGRGITPRGLVHGLRRGVYSMSQRARPSHA